MIGTRPLGRLAQALFALVLMCLATISCGGPGSAGTPNQDFATADEFFAGQFSGRVALNANQRLTFTFTGSTIGTVAGISVDIEDVVDFPDGVIPPFEARTYTDEEDGWTGVFDETNAAFTLVGIVETGSDEDLGVIGVEVPTQITGQGGGPFGSTTPGSFTLTLGGTAFTGTLIRGTFD
ncbi:hypothetical protein DYH09_16015 [bacterium CPR1]|nr:hypothetical protein [bacterium CPR1]